MLDRRRAGSAVLLGARRNAQAVAELEIAMAAWLETARERQIPIPAPRYRPALAG